VRGGRPRSTINVGKGVGSDHPPRRELNRPWVTCGKKKTGPNRCLSTSFQSSAERDTTQDSGLREAFFVGPPHPGRAIQAALFRQPMGFWLQAVRLSAPGFPSCLVWPTCLSSPPATDSPGDLSICTLAGRRAGKRGRSCQSTGGGGGLVGEGLDISRSRGQVPQYDPPQIPKKLPAISSRNSPNNP